MAVLAILVIVLILGLLFSAMILKIACTFVNVQQPTWGKACGIVIVAGIIHTMANLLLGSLLDNTNPMFNSLLSLVVGTGVSAGVYSAMLETEFWRGLIICIIQSIIGFIIAFVVVIFLLGAYFSTGGASNRRFNPQAQPSIVEPEEPERPTSFEVKD